MNLDALRFPDEPELPETLAQCLQVLVEAAGRHVDCVDVAATLGLSLMACADANDDDVERWTSLGGDFFLVDTARLFGIGLRPIHPPDAARGLHCAAEFRQHFDASYRPLITRALEHDQPIIAWMGWPEPGAAAWGIIDSPCDSAIGFQGIAAMSPGARIPLVAAPVQLYVVETIAPVTPAPAALVDMALHHTRRVVANTVGSTMGVVTGPAAYDRWMTVVNRLTNSQASSPSLLAAHAQVATRTVAAHESGARFFEQHCGVAPSAEQPLIAALIDVCRQVTDALSPLLDATRLGGLLLTRAGRKRLIDHIMQARAATVTATAALEARAKHASGE